jgi:hypothetical protein
MLSKVQNRFFLTNNIEAFDNRFNIFNYFLHLRRNVGGLAHPDSYREARVSEVDDCSF